MVCYLHDHNTVMHMHFLHSTIWAVALTSNGILPRRRFYLERYFTSKEIIPRRRLYFERDFTSKEILPRWGLYLEGDFTSKEILLTRKEIIPRIGDFTSNKAENKHDCTAFGCCTIYSTCAKMFIFLTLYSTFFLWIKWFSYSFRRFERSCYFIIQKSTN